MTKKKKYAHVFEGTYIDLVQTPEEMFYLTFKNPPRRSIVVMDTNEFHEQLVAYEHMED
jgi:hypothetical protein